MNKTNYITKIEIMIEKGIKYGTYPETAESNAWQKCMAQQQLTDLIVQITSN